MSTVVPKIPKISVDDLLMLEAPKPPSQPKPEKQRSRSNLEAQKPLPPIPGTPTEVKQRSRSQQDHARSRTVKIEDVEQDDSPRQTTQQAEGAFFMTQVWHVIMPSL